MTPEQFVQTYKPYAIACEKSTGISAKFILAQAALESGWGKRGIQNNLFGIKADKSWKGAKIAVTTTEILSNPNAKFPLVLSKVQRSDGKWVYKVQDNFRIYEDVAQGFIDHSRFFFQNPRYSKALLVKSDPNKFAEEVAKAGYATGDNYEKILKDMIFSVSKRWDLR